ncbi:MAG: glycosyltransferase family 2 protein [Bacteroidales bacterium]|jgi:glycosyltransferase involved in cell wall biosynthesis
MKLSVVIAAYNEEANAEPLLNHLLSTLEGIDFEIIYVDDGSMDATTDEVEKIRDTRIMLIEFRKNYGQSAALRAGIEAARGEYIVTMDADLQNDPDDIPLMLDIIEKKRVDVVAGLRKNRKDRTFSRKLPSLIANWLIRASTGLKTKDFGCSLRLYRSEFAKSLDLYGEMHRFIPVLLHLEGARVLQIPVNHHARKNGISKYNMNRSFKVLADLFLIIFFKRFMQKPMQLFGVTGILLSSIGIALNLYLLILKLLGRDIWGKPLLILAVIALIGGIQLITIGILSEILMRTYYESQDKKPYKIRRVLRAEQKKQETYFDHIKTIIK